MKITDAIQLIKNAPIDASLPNYWADLGCGSGTFTQALANLLPQESVIFAIDQSPQNFEAFYGNNVAIHFYQTNFENLAISLPKLDGILMANALHYIQDKVPFIQRMKNYLKPDGAFIIIEYDTLSSNPWVPYPIDFRHLSSLFEQEGYEHIIKLGERPSIYGGRNMYAAFSH